MDVRDLSEDVVDVRLAGRLDTLGVDKIELRFTAALVPKGKNAIVDMSGVPFVTSMGIRMFISVAKSLQAKQARLALYAPQELVSEVFENASLRQLFPICSDQAEALTAIQR